MGYGFGYFSRKFSSFIDYADVGTNYYTDMGFIQRIENYDAVLDTTIRLGFKSLFNQVSYDIFPKKGKINNHKFSNDYNIVFNPDGSFNEMSNTLVYSLGFKNTTEFAIGWSYQDIDLLFPVSFTDFDPLPKGSYRYHQAGMEYNSDSRKKLIFAGGIKLGEFYNGDIRQYSASIMFRAQPWGNFTLQFEQNELKFPDPYGNASLFLIAPKIEINFSNNLFWTTFIQYNTQATNININSRFQWRYKPMSDIFFVYTDNYFSNPFLKSRNRALVFKMNYWLNL